MYIIGNTQGNLDVEALTIYYFVPLSARSGILIRTKEEETEVAQRKHSEEQILAVVKQLEAGRTAAEMAREVGVSTFTIYSWKAKYGGLEPSEAARLRHLEDENSRSKRLVADLSLDREMLKALLNRTTG
jgi:putative transposase